MCIFLFLVGAGDARGAIFKQTTLIEKKLATLQKWLNLAEELQQQLISSREHLKRSVRCITVTRRNCMFSAMLLGLVALCALGASVGGTQTPVDNDGFEPKFVLVAAPPRMGTTWLFNAARILVRYYDPNVISGFAMSFNEKDLCYWRPRNVSMVVKTHALNLGWMLGANCGRASANGASAPQWTRGFDLALTSFRDPIDAACSLLRKDGNVQKNMCVVAASFAALHAALLLSQVKHNRQDLQ